jgi:uncharacterized protein YdhG (YjbR/CyaY superfamily)
LSRFPHLARSPEVDAYIAAFPEAVRARLEQIRDVMFEELGDVVESISYQIPTYKVENRRVVYFAGFAKHISMYPFGDELARALPETANYKTSGKGTIQFPHNRDLPLDLVRQITRLRLDMAREGR